MLQNRLKTAKIMAKRPDFMTDKGEKDEVDGTRFLKNYQAQLLLKSGLEIAIRIFFLPFEKKV